LNRVRGDDGVAGRRIVGLAGAIVVLWLLVEYSILHGTSVLYTVINIDRLVVDDRFLDRLYHLRTDRCYILWTMDRTLVVVGLLLAQQVSKDQFFGYQSLSQQN